VPVVGRPPVLRGRHHVLDVVLHGVEVEGLERLGVVEVVVVRPDVAGVLVEDLEVQLVRPPVLI